MFSKNDAIRVLLEDEINTVKISIHKPFKEITELNFIHLTQLIPTVCHLVIDSVGIYFYEKRRKGKTFT